MADPLVSASWPISRFTRALASTRPTPGGGSAAALAGAAGCSLGSMVGGILLARPGLRKDQRSRLEQIRRHLNRISARFQKLIREDAQAYWGWVKASRDSVPAARKTRLLAQAARCPLEICRGAVEALGAMRELSRRTGPYLGADVRAGAALLRGAFEAAQAMVEVNLKGAELGAQGRRTQRELLGLRRRLLRLETQRWNR